MDYPVQPLDSISVGIGTLVRVILDGKETFGRIEDTQEWFGTEYYKMGDVWFDETSIVDSYV